MSNLRSVCWGCENRDIYTDTCRYSQCDGYSHWEPESKPESEPKINLKVEKNCKECGKNGYACVACLGWIK